MGLKFCIHPLLDLQQQFISIKSKDAVAKGIMCNSWVKSNAALLGNNLQTVIMRQPLREMEGVYNRTGIKRTFMLFNVLSRITLILRI